MLTKKTILNCLKKVIDPELGIDIVSLGLIYDIKLKKSKIKQLSSVTKKAQLQKKPQLHIVMTLTTPGCPLASSFDTMIRAALQNIPGLDVNLDVLIELTFDPPWITDMMTQAAKAELGLDT